MLTKFWIPYIGISEDASYYRWGILYSPVAKVDVKLPFRYSGQDPNTLLMYTDETRYDLWEIGTFIECFLKLKLEFTPDFNCGFWTKAAYQSFQGQIDGSANDATWPNYSPTDPFGGNATLTSYSYSLGLNASMSF